LARSALTFAVGCGEPAAPLNEVAADEIAAPSITDVSVTCDLEAGSWRVEVGTDAWATGGVLLWTLDGAWVERHETLRSVRAAPDGTSDLLRADLTIVSDFRPAGTGGVTIFTCNDAPTARVWVLGPRGGVADCRRFGAVPELLDGQDAPACPTAWEPPDQGDTDAP
jgi:hypothetical protein